MQWLKEKDKTNKPSIKEEKTMQWLKDKTNKLNQRREDNAMAKRKRQDKQTVNL
jgi:hypothetical protein